MDSFTNRTPDLAEYEIKTHVSGIFLEKDLKLRLSYRKMVTRWKLAKAEQLN